MKYDAATGNNPHPRTQSEISLAADRPPAIFNPQNEEKLARHAVMWNVVCVGEVRCCQCGTPSPPAPVSDGAHGARRGPTEANIQGRHLAATANSNTTTSPAGRARPIYQRQFGRCIHFEGLKGFLCETFRLGGCGKMGQIWGTAHSRLSPTNPMKHSPNCSTRPRCLHNKWPMLV